MSGPYYIAPDNTVHQYTLTNTGIRLDSGQELPDSHEVDKRLFVTDPTTNPNLELINGEWLYLGKPL